MNEFWEGLREGTELLSLQCIHHLKTFSTRSSGDNSRKENELGDDDDEKVEEMTGMVMKIVNLFITMLLNSLHQGLLHVVSNDDQ